jgi:hypothetical protein
MPWKGPDERANFPTLGWQVGEWIEEHCAIPDREDAGDSFLLTNEQWEFLAYHYRLDPGRERFAYERGSQLLRPQKWGKAPLSAAMICAEAAGPVLFDGWDAAGDPVGKPWPTPWIQCVACSEDQVANVWRVLIPMITLGSLDADIPDTGDTRVNLPSGGRIEPVTAAARSRFGQRVTFAVMDETHLWTEGNGGWRLAETLGRNLAGTAGRWVETSNAFDPVENSVAQRTFELKAPGVYKDDADPPAGSVRNKEERRRVLRAVYGDSVRSALNPRGWIDLDRIDVEIEALLEHDPAVAERYFLNRKLASEGAAFNFEHFKTLKSSHKPAAHSVVVIGVDGARREDALAIVATDVKSGFMWPLGIWERPEHAPDTYEHPANEVDGAMQEAFDRFNVWRVYIDDQWIDHLVELWANRWGDKRIKAWHTNRQQQIAWAVREFEQAIGAGDVSHDGSPVFVEHVRNARKRALTVRDDHERFMHTLSKDSIRSPRKIDAAMAAVLSWKARGDCIEAGVVWMGENTAPEPDPEPERWVPGRALPAEALTGVGSYGPMGPMS